MKKSLPNICCLLWTWLPTIQIELPSVVISPSFGRASSRVGIAVSCHISFGRASSRVGIAVTLSYLLRTCVLTSWHRRQLSYLLRQPCVLTSWHRRYVVISPSAAAMMSPVRTMSYHHSKWCGRVGNVGALVLRPGDNVTGDVRSCSLIDADGVASNFMPVHASCRLN